MYSGKKRTETIKHLYGGKPKSTELWHAKKSDPKTLDSKTFFAQFWPAVQRALYSRLRTAALYSRLGTAQKKVPKRLSHNSWKKIFFFIFFKLGCALHVHIPIKFQSNSNQIPINLLKNKSPKYSGKFSEILGNFYFLIRQSPAVQRKKTYRNN